MNQRGFSQVILLGIITVFVMVGAGGFLALREKGNPSSEKTVQQEISPQRTGGETQKPKAQQELKPKSVSPPSLHPSAPALGNLCFGEETCVDFCSNNRGRCESYCTRNENELCGIIFPREEREGELMVSSPSPSPGVVSSLTMRFSALEKEIFEANASGSYFAPAHYERIKSDLTELQDQGYPTAEIGRLLKLAMDLSPHLRDQQNTSATQSPPSQCVNNPNPVFSAHITDMSMVSYVVPPPTMGSGPSLKTHSYMGTNGANVPVYAPTAITLKSGSHYVGGPYGFEFQASCEVTVRFGHITHPVDSIKKLLPADPKSDSRTQELSPVSFAAGDLIGYTTGTDAAGNWDFGVYNSSTSNRYANEPNWNNSSVYTTAVCPFDYFAPNLKAAYTAKFDFKILGGNPPHGESFCR